jgi:Xaa-Pro aminopeptidase
MADFHGRNDIAMGMLGLKGHLTRRSFYFIPVQGEPVALVNPIEKAKFLGLPGKTVTYMGYKGLESELRSLLSGNGRIAMEYSPQGRLPYIGLVDAGTIEFVRSLGVEIVSSADMVAAFQARLSPEQIAAHRMAARNVNEIKDRAFQFIADSISSGSVVSEYDVCQYIMSQFGEYDMVTDVGPVCAVDAHAGDPHYEPTAEKSTVITRGQLILIDLWAKLEIEHGVFGDITWMAYAGTKDDIPPKYVEVFDVLTRARDAAAAFLRDSLGSRPVYGYEVDDVCRGVIEAAGYGEYFTHRTGHSIASNVHGPGPNIDNLETEDQRKLQQGHLFSIEPGIYTDEFGFRTEIDVLVSHEGAEVTTLPVQTEILPLF